jgi:uncharacterized membrane protein YdjX (TVP38/TMEM64 family)
VKRLLPRLLIAGVLLVGIAVAIYYRDRFNVAALHDWISQAGALAVVAFILTYALAAVLFLPGSIFTLAGGALFGPIWGTFYNLVGATLGATLAFLVARYLASDWVEQKTGGRLKRLIEGVEQEGWRFVAFTRLVPIFPFNLLNYGFGLTRVKLSHFVIASLICMLPGTLAFTYIGFVGREALSGEQEGLIRNGLIALALLAIVAFIPRVVKRLRRAPQDDAATPQNSGR